MKHRGLLSLILFLFILSCFSGGGGGMRSGFSYRGDIAPGEWLEGLTVTCGEEGNKADVRLRIYFPKGYEKGEPLRTLIALHGYRGSMYDWGRYTAVETYADRYNMAIVCPDMGRSVYSTTYYPETSHRWAPVPGTPFIGEVLLSNIASTFNLGTRKNRTGIFGLSTGARGAIMVAETYPGRFAAAAGLSGDYDPLSMTHDRVLASVYGPYKDHGERWKEEASPVRKADSLKNVAVFLSHGGKDRVIPRGQSLIMALKLRSLAKKSSAYSVVYVEKGKRKHDWGFWRSCVPEVFAFFNRELASSP
jgi:S-formylglutathione hydrolase FrmB